MGHAAGAYSQLLRSSVRTHGDRHATSLTADLGSLFAAAAPIGRHLAPAAAIRPSAMVEVGARGGALSSTRVGVEGAYSGRVAPRYCHTAPDPDGFIATVLCALRAIRAGVGWGDLGSFSRPARV